MDGASRTTRRRIRPFWPREARRATPCGLGKPLDRLIVTHAHPDHHNGAARFGVPVHALAPVREQIVARGDSRLPTGQVIPVTDCTPTVTLVPGTEVIDGVTGWEQALDLPAAPTGYDTEGDRGASPLARRLLPHRHRRQLPQEWALTTPPALSTT
ncbi:hypothetical protein ABZ646_13335 [Streptomyces sp. NPDC007162]|uniref:hypothetical protein n=1 Tax=Streptomyces sp. NPDC007162 TaxID=3156917 RepID=UPI0033F2627B